MTIELNRLERSVMEMLLAGDDPVLSILRDQYRVADAVSREVTGVGFFVNFAVPTTAPRLERCEPSMHIGDVGADGEGLPYGAGFVLHIRDGVIDFLEGATFEGPWPEQTDDLRLSYDGGSVRNLNNASWKSP